MALAARAIVAERRHPHAPGEELELPDELPVRRRHTGWIFTVAAVVVAALGAYQFTSERQQRSFGYLARTVVPDARPSATALGESGGVKLTFALPSQELSYPLDVHGDPTALQYAWVRNGETALATAPRPLAGARVFAPDTAGFFRLALLKGNGQRQIEGLTLAVLVPFDEKEGGMLRGYRIGTYLAERVRGKTPPPEGFLEITERDLSLPITTHLRVGDFLNHDGQKTWPRYAAVSPKLLDKLELVIAEVTRWHGEGAKVNLRLDVSSGFRAPEHNRRVRRAARDSQHQYGDAVDIAIDANNDGRITAADSRMVGLAVEIVELKHPDLVGGLGIYTRGHGKTTWVHIDTRGRRARWRG